MKIFDEDRREKVDIAFIIVLVLCCLIVFIFLIQGIIFPNRTMAVIVICSLSSALWFVYRKKYYFLILSALALTSGTYYFTYSIQYPPLKQIDSSFYFEKNDIAEFDIFNSQIRFQEKETILAMELEFNIERNINQTNSFVSFFPPNSAYYYLINISGNVYRKVNGSWETSQVIPFTIENGSISNNSFPELKKIIIPLEPGRFKMSIGYKLPKMDPHVRLRMWMNGYLPGEKFKHVYSSVLFSDILYECVDPCIVVLSRNMTPNPQYVETLGSEYNEELEKPTAIYSVSGDEVSEVHYDIRTIRKLAVILRNLMLAIIAGLILSLSSVPLRYKKRRALDDKEQRIECKECGKRYKIINKSHLKTHGMDVATYKEKYPEAPLSYREQGEK